MKVQLTNPAANHIAEALVESGWSRNYADTVCHIIFYSVKGQIDCGDKKVRWKLTENEDRVVSVESKK